MKCNCGQHIDKKWADMARDEPNAEGITCPSCGDTIPFEGEPSEKELMKEAFLAGHAYGKDVENVSEISKKAARSEFERWYSVNHK